MFEFQFMQNALLAILLITPLFGLMGTLVVDNRLAFFSDALGHSALTGIALGTLIGISDPTIAMVLFAMVFAYLLNRIRRAGVASTDTVISVFSSTAIALGLALLSKGGNFSKFSAYLIGDILAIRVDELWALLVVFVGIVLFWVLCYNQLFAISVSPLVAGSRGIKVRLLETLLVLAVAVVVTVSIEWVGVLIINSLLILPAAAARNLAQNVRQYHLFSVALSMASGVLGLIVSAAADIATGPTIVLVSAVFFFISYLLRGKLKA